MQAALDAARDAAGAGEVPVGAAVTRDGALIAAAGNRTLRDADPTAHAEVVAIRAACAARATPVLDGCTLTVTLEPCAMCAGAIALARVPRVIFGAYDPKGGGVEHGARVFERATCHHRPEVVGGVAASVCGDLLRDFFADRR